MINVTVKTLDSQNHQFSVDDGATVEQFKRQIQDVVDIPADRQRIIYCGRVLRDQTKLNDYDVDGKVVHLVQRAPPNATNRNPRSVTPPPDFSRPRGGFRTFDRIGNTLYMGMGSMAFPQNLMDPQQMIPPRATHTLSASRLNVARRMLRNAEQIIRSLENPTGDQAPPEEPHEEEMTPVIEARVIVPSNGDQPIDENVIANAVENTLYAAGAMEQTASTSSQNHVNPNGQSTAPSTPATSSPRSASTENLRLENNTDPSQQNNASSQFRSRTREMAELLTTLNQLQTRFAPFLAQYHAFMQDDPEVPPENLQQTRLLLKQVSQILHLFGHAYHSLSDIMINVDQPPPRLLFCRPILIQHSAVVQAGIPIQVEAQIDLSADSPRAPSTNTSTATATSTTSAGSTVVTTAPASVNASSNSTPAPSITLQPGFVGLPFMPAGSVRLISTPVEFRSVRPNSSRPRLNNAGPNTESPAEPSLNDTPTTTASQTPPSGLTSQPVAQGQGPAPGNPFGGSNGNLEFFMEVTREDLRSGNLIESLMELVGSQLEGGLGQAQQQVPQITSNSSEAQTSQQNGPTQNNSQSQARGNTQTNPTTATHTRSTPRPHVHMTQQAVQGGFDPFLPCYSHHVTPSRGQRIVPVNQPNRTESAGSREAASAQTSSTSTQTNQGLPQRRQLNSSELMASHIDNMVRGIQGPGMVSLATFLEDSTLPIAVAESLSSVFQQAAQQAQQQASQQTQPQGSPQRGMPDGQGAPSTAQQQARTFLRNVLNNGMPETPQNEATVDSLIRGLYPRSVHVRGASVLVDFIMLMLSNMRLDDLVVLTRGDMAPLHRHLDTIRRFFREEVCQNDVSERGIERGRERVFEDCRFLVEAFEAIPPRADVDLPRTVSNFLRRRLSYVIRMAVSRSGGDLVGAIWRVLREMLALGLYCSSSGPAGIMDAFEAYRLRYREQAATPPVMHAMASSIQRSALESFIDALDIRPVDIEHYVIRRTVETPTPQVPEATASAENAEEAMEVDYASSNPSNGDQAAETDMKADDAEPLPNVIWGSEPWHRQTPEEWVPIITRDVQKQRRQNSQSPFSDAYLSGMPSKRRKMITKAKPQGSLSQVITDSVREAVTATGLTTAAPLDTVATAAGQSPEVQSAYRNLLINTVQTNLRDNEDFTPERFPNASNYFKGTPPE